jgi:hypothetical protein
MTDAPAAVQPEPVVGAVADVVTVAWRFPC